MKKKSNFLVRTITGLCLMLILVPAVYFGGIYYLVLTTILSIVATYELLNMFYTKHSNLKIMRFILPIFSGLSMVSFYYGITNNLGFISFVPIILGIIVVMLFGVLKDGTDASDITSCITSLIYGGLLFACAFSVEYLKPLQEVSNIKFVGRLFAYMYSIVVCTDTFAYCFGMLFGKHKLCPKISPKKSVEGAVAGLVLGALVGTVVGALLEVFPISTLANTTQKVLMIAGVYVISLIISAMGQLGDLVASKLKRSYEIKDYGFIFPGHGGVMDRFDSVIFAGAIFFILMQVIYLFV